MRLCFPHWLLLQLAPREARISVLTASNFVYCENKITTQCMVYCWQTRCTLSSWSILGWQQSAVVQSGFTWTCLGKDRTHRTCLQS